MDGMRIPLLIVEDDVGTRIALSRLLGRRGWSVSTASCMSEGIDLIGSEPACILLDLDLPDGTGEGVLRAIRRAGLRSRVIVSTAATDHARLERLKELEPDAIIHKPVDVDNLLEACCT